MDTLGSKSECYTVKVQDDGYIKLLEVLKLRREACKDGEYGTIVVSNNDHKRRVEHYCFVYWFQEKM